MFYSTKPNNGLTVYNEVWFEKSKIKINNDLTGLAGFSLGPLTIIPEFQEEYEILTHYMGNQNQYKKSVSDPLNGNKDDMVYYFNILMDIQATEYNRKHYTILDLFKD